MKAQAPLRIGLDATYALDREPTGVAVYSREILNGVAELCARGQLRPAEGQVNAYVRPHRLRTAWRASLPGNVSRRLLLDALAPGVALFHGLNQRLPPRKKNRFAVTFHDLFVMTGEYSTPEFRQRFSALARQAAERADLIIAVSHFTATQVRDLLHIEPSRIRVVYHGVHAPPQVAPIGPRQPWLLHVGALQSRKNITSLVEAFEQTAPGWRLKLAGGLGYGSAAIRDRIARSPRQGDIDILGYVSRAELERLYASCSALAFPSLDEGFGIPVLEAMAYGLPVVTSLRSATTEVAGEAAVMTDPTSVDSIAAGLKRVMAEPKLRQRLAQAGLERAAAFPWARAVAETAAVYRELL
jgi:glycosyltransferase involved in cell wall biosynthesis